MSLLSLSTVVMLLSGALLTGGVVWYAWDRSALWRTLSLEAFARDYRYSMGRADPAQPILLIFCLVAAIGFAVSTPSMAFPAANPSRLLALAAAAGLMVNLVLSLALLVPTQNRFVRQPDGTLPSQADVLRRRWLRGHLFRASIVVASFTLLVLAVVAH